MNNYYFKYLKYKIKYMSHKGKKEQEFKKLIKDNLQNGLINIDFLHDNSSNQVKGKVFFDMVNEKAIKIYDKSQPDDLESFIHNELIDLAVGETDDSVMTQYFSINNNENKIDNLSDYICILDKSVDNEEMKIKLKTIFGITQYEKTFIGNCEKFLNSSNVEIDDIFLDKKGELKKEYKLEAVKIGFLPISKNTILNFNTLSSKDPDKLYKELNKLKLYIEETIHLFGRTKNEFLKLFISDLIIAKTKLENINNKNDVENKYLNPEYRETTPTKSTVLLQKTSPINETKDIIEKIIISLKEARDIYYIEEIKQKMEKQKKNKQKVGKQKAEGQKIKKYILVSGDLIQCYRAILEDISCINVVLSMIRFMSIYNDNKLNIIGNPFELISSNDKIVEKYINHKIKKSLISDILSNPIINLRRNASFNTKYFLDNYDRIYTYEFMLELMKLFVDDPQIPGTTAISSTELNLEKKKEYMDYLLNFARNNIKDEKDLLYILEKIKSKHKYHTPFDNIINKLNEVIYENTRDDPLIEGDKPIEESTWQFQIFYLCTAYAGFTLIEYMIPLGKLFYPNEFNWDVCRCHKTVYFITN